MKRATVLLADDHQIVTEGLRAILEAEFELIGTVGDGRALVQAAVRLQPDVVVADISMPLLNGIDAVQEARQLGSRAKVVFLTMHADATYARRAFDAGALGFVLKHSAPQELVTAIREALRDRMYVTPLIAKDLFQEYRKGSAAGGDPYSDLSPRQRGVLQLIAEGHSAKEVAELLHLSPRTVEYHKYQIMKTLRLESGAELVQYAVKHGLVAL